MGLDLLIIEVSRSHTHTLTHTLTHTHTHTHTPKSAGLLWIRKRPLAETPTRQHISLTRDRHP
jgi:hypothetical protein